MDHCPSADQLAELLTDRLGTAEREALEAHVGGCAPCQETLLHVAGPFDHDVWPRGVSEATPFPDEPSAGFLAQLKQAVLPKEKLLPGLGAEAVGIPSAVTRQGEVGRATAWERAWQWTKRRPTAVVACSIGVSALLFTIGAGGVELARARRARLVEAAERQKAEESRERAEKALEVAETDLYRSRIALAERACAAHDFAEAQKVLNECLPRPGRPDRRGGDWSALWQRCSQR